MTRCARSRRQRLIGRGLFPLLVGLLVSSTALGQRATPGRQTAEATREPTVIELPLQSIQALTDRPGYRASPRSPDRDALGQRHPGTIPLRTNFRAKAAASAGAL